MSHVFIRKKVCEIFLSVQKKHSTSQLSLHMYLTRENVYEIKKNTTRQFDLYSYFLHFFPKAKSVFCS